MTAGKYTVANADQWAEQLKWDENGLLPAIVQDAVSKEVLMMAYMNKESLAKTLETGETWFWSRSRKELWHKGATSGNIQCIVELYQDCDQDTLLIHVVPAGPACHNGTYSCFVPAGERSAQDSAETGDRYAILNRLEQVIAEREAEMPEGAYTTYLFEKGVDKILKKVGEEAAEVIIAAKNRDAAELSNESADLLFHWLVLLREQKLPIDEVLAVLRSRHGQKKQ
ncbi:bifunctional phosphoribosyl-AMP cyclohydrolase/phosphoribosyl-ATP diphosphatase HisIE [Xylanibacillus composti]|uniref:Histidine biosynthesis bifunctional protein HisIE n=1 Tax=Xylanibacillus composti TaxID=1572762 RepID=A0A8J4GYC5_9BACL|nr:bifunctional phosphoribosyl-AMP cyclohydrolase/phosphoribosyl-ATP diphosphatase HisIE [Xylanibacillus composti]MDT9725063.1 bifunctional phosphoribosyl-AMP cyclohydrolase/phosphoribosyl-ATP diphosphatase HisIE [Xylanibacillus composti]GIQ67457.1 histidine biosynthesis bifunctional protein HisIE [Xylanibacillus composti]